MTVRWLTAFIDRPAEALPAAVAFWTRVTGTVLSAARGERGQFATLVPEDGDAFLKVQAVLDGRPEGHLDVHVDDVDGAAKRARALGATAVPQAGYVTLTSPAGLRWCLVPVPGGVAGELQRPAPPRRADGGTSLVDQLCIDIPPTAFEAECAFWQAVTGWELLAGARPEFAVLRRPPGMPLRLLLQRLDDDPADVPARCHLDLASTDIDREVALHKRWGARVVARHPSWTTLEDPSGGLYCITRRDPITGTLPPS